MGYSPQQRLHKEMTRYGLSEVGMEARRQMISEEGRAYHRALEKKQMEEFVMKSIITAIAMTALFSSFAYADSGLADRINEARSYPNKTVETVDRQELCLKHQK